MKNFIELFSIWWSAVILVGAAAWFRQFWQKPTIVSVLFGVVLLIWGSWWMWWAIKRVIKKGKYP